MKRLAIIGASGHGKAVAELAELCGYNVAFFDDAYPNKVQVEHWQVHGATKDIAKQDNSLTDAIVAIGDNSIRLKLSNEVTSFGLNLVTLIHPSAVVSKYSTIGAGSVVLANSVISGFTTIGRGAIVNTSVVVEHDCVVGDFVHLSPNAAIGGGCTIKDLAWLGIGSSMIHLTHVGSRSIVGAGSVVVRDVPDNVVVIGAPARIKRGL